MFKHMHSYTLKCNQANMQAHKLPYLHSYNQNMHACVKYLYCHNHLHIKYSQIYRKGFILVYICIQSDIFSHGLLLCFPLSIDVKKT